MVNIPLSSDEESKPGPSNDNDISSNNNGSGNGPTSMHPPAHHTVSLDTEHVEEKGRLIQQVFQLQNTLDDLAQRVDAVKDENVKLKSENLILGQYIENLMAASSVFQGSKGGKGRSDKPAEKRKR